MRRWLFALDHGFDAAFGAAANPLKQLGPLAFLLLWLLAGSGIVLYALLETSLAGAYRSVATLAGGAGAALRGLHRYGADAFVLVALAHLAREWALGRYGGFRRYSWTTGVLLLPLVLAGAIGGFWLHWDRLGQFSAVATAEWADALPFVASPLARNFLPGGMSDRLFSLFVFVHLGLPLLLVFAAWAHLQRVAGAAMFPRRALAAGTALTLLALALAVPVRSQGPADLASAPARLAFDWLLLFVHPLAEATSAATAWIAVAVAMVALLGLALLPGRRRMPAARVDPAHCNGCGRCIADCPYAAITLVPHPGRRAGVQLAQVKAARCAGCGLCAGACPSATPFRADFASGIDLPQAPLADLRERLRQGLQGGRRRVVFGCDHGADVAALDGSGVLALSLPCSGMLPPAFVDYAWRHGASDVLVAGCREGGCEFRFGQRWTEERLRGEREPHLRRSASAPRPRAVWADAGEERRLREALEQTA